MDKLLNEMEFELSNIKNLFEALDNCLLYCLDNRVETDHLHTLSNYACKRLDRFINKFEKAEVEYYTKHVAEK